MLSNSVGTVIFYYYYCVFCLFVFKSGFARQKGLKKQSKNCSSLCHRLDLFLEKRAMNLFEYLPLQPRTARSAHFAEQ